jgi:hypothetical protein
MLKKVVSKKFFDLNILPEYLKFSKESSWQIRKACADIIIDVCEKADKE